MNIYEVTTTLIINTTLVLYQNTAEKNRVDKSSYLLNGLALEGYLRGETSVVNPSILIEISKQNEQQVLFSYNYLYYKPFNRYYFIDNIVSVGNNLWRIECTCDVLMSFKDKIKELNCFVGRNEFKYDPTINDELVPIDSEVIYGLERLRTDDSAYVGFQPSYFANGNSCIISVLEEKEE